MKIIDYFRAEDPSHWLNEIEKCDWDAGRYLHELLQSDSLKELVGENTRVLRTKVDLDLSRIDCRNDSGNPFTCI